MHSLMEMSIIGAILIIVIIILRALLINRMPKKVFLVLWATALARLILPFSLSSPVSIYRTLEEQLPVGQAYRPLLITQGGVSDTTSPVSPLPILWLAGMLLLALAFLITHLRSRRNYSASLPVENSFVKSWTDSHRLRRPVQTRYSDQIGTPFTYGILWPVVVLPKSINWKDEETLGYILTHEFSHIRRFDTLTKWILAAVLCLHWFNPLVWAMYVLANRDLELSCDEAVLRQYGVTSRSSYALALVSMEEYRSCSAPLSVGFSRQALKERIIAIMSSRPLTLGSILAAGALIVITVAIFATTAPTTATASGQSGLLIDEQSGLQANGQSEIRNDESSSKPALKEEETPGASQNNEDKEYWDDPDYPDVYEDYEDYKPDYTKEQYDRLIAALTIPDYENMSISEFNRRVNAAFSEDSNNAELFAIYERVLSSIPEEDPNAAYLINTVQISMNEYQTRMSEVYTGEKTDHKYYGEAMIVRMDEIFGDQITVYDGESTYCITYRILDQDRLTVIERDAFVQQISLAAQSILEGMEISATEKEYTDALTAAGKRASTNKIEFTGCEIIYFNRYEND